MNLGAQTTGSVSAVLSHGQPPKLGDATDPEQDC